VSWMRGAGCPKNVVGLHPPRRARDLNFGSAASAAQGRTKFNLLVMANWPTFACASVSSRFQLSTRVREIVLPVAEPENVAITNLMSLMRVSLCTRENAAHR
jgi:hypothetical protein